MLRQGHNHDRQGAVRSRTRNHPPEDGLVNNRVTWLLVLQGFLLAAFVNGVGLYKMMTMPWAGILVTAGLFLIGALGIIASLPAHRTIKGVYEQITAGRQSTGPWDLARLLLVNQPLTHGARHSLGLGTRAARGRRYAQLCRLSP